jgi:hypothetical protein
MDLEMIHVNKLQCRISMTGKLMNNGNLSNNLKRNLIHMEPYFRKKYSIRNFKGNLY